MPASEPEPPAPRNVRFAAALLRTISKARRNEPLPMRPIFASIAVIATLAVTQHVMHRHAVERDQARILHDRAALAESTAPQYASLRTRVEAWTVELAKEPWTGDHVASVGDPLGTAATDFRERPAIYLRLPATLALNAASVHANAQTTAIDGLAACLLAGKNGGPWAYGEIIAREEMLGASFVDDVRSTTNDLRLRNLSYALDTCARTDHAIASTGIRKAEFAVIAVDEGSTTNGDHPVRLSVRRLSDGVEILRVRRTPEEPMLVPASTGNEKSTAEVIALARSQALGCTMANEALAVVR